MATLNNQFNPGFQNVGKRQAGFLRGQGQQREQLVNLAQTQSRAQSTGLQNQVSKQQTEVNLAFQEQQEDITRAHTLARQDVDRFISQARDFVSRLNEQFQLEQQRARFALNQLASGQVEGAAQQGLGRAFGAIGSSVASGRFDNIFGLNTQSTGTTDTTTSTEGEV